MRPTRRTAARSHRDKLKRLNSHRRKRGLRAPLQQFLKPVDGAEPKQPEPLEDGRMPWDSSKRVTVPVSSSKQTGVLAPKRSPRLDEIETARGCDSVCAARC